jgi:hypothetical protein
MSGAKEGMRKARRGWRNEWVEGRREMCFVRSDMKRSKIYDMSYIQLYIVNVAGLSVSRIGKGQLLEGGAPVSPYRKRQHG